jgi:methionyl-tRNA formyltransferase
VANTTWRRKTLRLWETGPLVQKNTPGMPGTVVQADAGGVAVQTGEGVLTITRLQAEGGKILTVGEFLNGHPLVAGDRMGDEAHSNPPAS